MDFVSDLLITIYLIAYAFSTNAPHVHVTQEFHKENSMLDTMVALCTYILNNLMLLCYLLCIMLCNRYIWVNYSFVVWIC